MRLGREEADQATIRARTNLPLLLSRNGEDDFFLIQTWYILGTEQYFEGE
jgi:hypothetical protein